MSIPARGLAAWISCGVVYTCVDLILDCNYSNKFVGYGWLGTFTKLVKSRQRCNLLEDLQGRLMGEAL